ncbi:MAG: hypothetical protein EAZ55_10730 [Cytophagales bacterium]|nr:MAG: hypothetical protein EAZ55_10730 [Cytophagales bacterium]
MLLPTLTFLLIFQIVPQSLGYLSEENKWRLLTLIFLVTFAVPNVSLLTLVILNRGTIADLAMKNRQDRFFPFVFTSIFYSVSTYFFYQYFSLFPIIGAIMFSITLTIICVTIITFYWQVSAHSAGIAGVFAFLIVLTLKTQEVELVFPIILACIAVGVLSSARLYLNAHSLNQVLVGIGLGFFLNFSVLWASYTWWIQE